MIRSIRLLAGAVVVVVASVALAQPPEDLKAPEDAKARDSGNYFPLRPKSKWTYKVQDQTVEVVVAGTERVINDICTKVDTLVNGKVVASELYVVKADGVYRVKVKDDKIDPPIKVLALPVQKDATWEFKSKVGSQTVSGVFRIKDDRSKVETPAGKFEAVLVEGQDLDVAGTKTTVRTWFGKDTGIVKLEYKIQDAVSTLELTKADLPASN